MSFNNTTVNESLSDINLKIESYSGDRNIDHRKCDYIELLALLNTDELYKDNLISRFFADDSDRIQDYEGEDYGEEARDNNRYDEYENELNKLFNILKFRQTLFEENYPFIIEEDSIKMKEPEEININHKLYLTLLCCSNLNKFSKNIQYKLTEEFEEITYISLSNFLPQFQLKRMGANSDYQGNTKTKLNLLSLDLNILTDNEQIDNLPNTASKEKGVDLFGWKSFKDKIPNMLMLSVQCACGEDSSHKINEAENYHNYLYFSTYKIDPIIILSVPKAITLNFNNIKNRLEVMKKNSLFLDRSRLMETCSLDISKLENLESYILVDALIEKSLSLLD